MQTPEQPHSQSQEETESLKEKERMEINKHCYERARKTIESVRNAWRNREYKNEKELEIDKKTCALEARKREILLNLLEEKKIDFTRGYRRMMDDIVGSDNPDSINFKNMARTHSKFLDNEIAYEYKIRLTPIFKEEQEAGLLKYNAIDFSRKRLGLNEPQYQLGYGMEEYLGGKLVWIDAEQGYQDNINIDAPRLPIFIQIRERIMYDREAKKFFIEPGTEAKDIVGRLRIQEIPTITSDTPQWHAHYKE